MLQLFEEKNTESCDNAEMAYKLVEDRLSHNQSTYRLIMIEISFKMSDTIDYTQRIRNLFDERYPTVRQPYIVFYADTVY